VNFLALAQRLESIQADAMRALAREAAPLADGWMTANGPGSYLNKAVGFGLGSEVGSEALGALEAFFSTRGIEPKAELTAFAPIPLLRALGERGFVLQELENVLVRPLVGLGNPRQLLPSGWPADVQIQRLDPRNSEQVRTFVETSASGFFPEEEPLPDEFLATGIRAVNRPEHDGFIAYLDGVAVGAGGCATRRGVTSLFGTSVRPAFRGRGIQQALMAARLERAVALGSELAEITSRPGIPTERNAARFGFQMAYARIVLVKRGPGLVPSP
jgi:GNAT superfamily N-acetyltransferase